MFCPRCGKTDEKLFEGICKSCFIKETLLLDVLGEMEITFCAHCGSILIEGKWKNLRLSEEETIFRVIKEHISVNHIAENVEIHIETLSARGNIIECLIQARGEVLGKILKQEYKITVKLNKTVCSDCSKFTSGYYEAVIQIRAHNRFPSNEEIKIIDGVILDNIERISEKNRMAYVSERVEIKEGVDYYIGSYKVAKRLVGAIKDALGGFIKESPRLMGKDKNTGKDLYRIWISLRIPYFQKGDFIKYGDSLGQITVIDSKKVTMKELHSMRKLSILWRDYDKIKTMAKRKDVEKGMVTAKTPRSIQILHPKTYQPVDIEIQDMNDIEVGYEIPVIEIQGNLYILRSD